MRLITLVENTSGPTYCQGEHGLSFYIETQNHRLLVDFGSTDLFSRNANLLQVDLTQVDTCVLSHGHYDHAGGLLHFSSINPKASIYLQSSAGDDYYSFSSGYEKFIGIDKRILQLPQCIFVNGDLAIDQELFLFTKINGSRCLGRDNVHLKKKIGENFIQDTFDHEQCLVITQGSKRILLSGCAHNGILSILDRYHSRYHSYPDVVISGFHLMQKKGYSEEDLQNIRNIGQLLKDTQSIFYTGHCTGDLPYEILKETMGHQLFRLHSGLELFL